MMIVICRGMVDEVICAIKLDVEIVDLDTANGRGDDREKDKMKNYIKDF